MSLRDMYFYEFNTDFQQGVHDCTTDAQATMRIFRFGYLKDPTVKVISLTECPSLIKMEKQG